MLAIDTNVIVRYLTGDHPKQSARARAVIDGEDVFVATTVLLETEWVLRSAYAFDPAQVCKALRAFAGSHGSRWKTRRLSRSRSTAWTAAWTSPMRFTSGGPKPAMLL